MKNTVWKYIVSIFLLIISHALLDNLGFDIASKIIIVFIIITLFIMMFNPMGDIIYDGLD